MYIISFIVGSLAASAMALEYADLAPCGQICIKSMFEQAYNMNCPPYPDGRPNVECLCKDANFLNGIHDCAFATCNTPDAENTVSLAAIYCTDPKYKSPDCPCLDPLLQPGASPAIIAPAPEVNSNSDSGSGSPANNDDVSNSSDSTTSNPNSNSNTNSDDGAIPNGGNNDNTFVATPTTNGDGAVSSNDVETGEGGGLKTVTAYVAPKVSELGNTASAGASKTNELDHADASTPTSTSSGATEKNGTGAREMGNLRERVLLAVVLGFVMVL